MAIELPGGPEAKPHVMGKWGSLNTRVDRAALPEDDFSWLENWFPIDPGNLRTLWAEGSTLFTTTSPRKIVSLFPYNFGSTAYVALFLDDGSALQINAVTGASTTIGPAGTFYSGGAIPACSQYQSQYLIIGSDVSTNAYWVWNGTALFAAGGIAPQVIVTGGGDNYTSAPTVTAYGGSGTGATFTATVANNQVATVTCTNPGSGYGLYDQPVLGFSGGGSDTAAVAIPYVALCSGVSAINVTLGGKFSTQSATVAVSAPPSGTTVVVKYDVVGGVPTNLTVSTTGTAYWTGPITFALNTNYSSGTHSTVTLTPNADGTLTAGTITNNGGAYTNGTGLTQSGTAPVAGVTATAIATCTADGSGNYYVSSVTVTNCGWGYTSPPTITITGGGTVTTAPTALANITRGQITNVIIKQGGTGYSGNPSVIFSGANDPAAVITQTAEGTATISAGAVTGVTLTTYGYGYQTASTRLSGGNNAASAVCTLMPFGVQATAIETYNNQVWTTANPATGPKMSFTAPNSVSDFGTFDGGGSAPATDSFLRAALIGLKQNSGYLYRFGDSSVNTISNVSTSSSGVTTYNNSNVDSQMGTPWRDTICSFDRAIVFANSTGVYALFGGAVQKVSDQLDGLFQKASFNTGQAGITPTAAVCTIFGIRCYVLLFTTTDPYTETLRNVMCVWNGQRWFAATQTKTLTSVALQELNSVFTAWGTDGTRLFKLFQTPSAALTKVAQTRLDGANLPDAEDRVDALYVVGNVTSGGNSTLNITVDTERGIGPTQSFTFPAARQVVPSLPTPGGATYGVLRGLTITTTAQDMQVISIERVESEYARMVSGVSGYLVTEPGEQAITTEGGAVIDLG